MTSQAVEVDVLGPEADAAPHDDPAAPAGAVPTVTSTSQAAARVSKLVRVLRRRVLADDPEYREYATMSVSPDAGAMVNYIFATTGDDPTPEAVFEQLRWGGLLVYAARDAREVEQIQQRFNLRGGFIIDRKVEAFRSGFLGLPIPGLSTRGHYFAARKVELIQRGQMTDRFTYNVRLVLHPQHGYVVLKEVPELANVAWRLQQKHPDVDSDTIAKRAAKLVDSVFPVFLTREAAILKLLQRDMPPPYNDRIPKVVDLEKDQRGFVRRLYLNWLRMGGEPLPQIEFAKQSADLLRVLHDKGGMIHLDLRLDNIVISRGKVSFVDFGSAVRVGEDLTESPLLTSLFEEMMRTSQIQRLLGKWKDAGKITSKVISEKHRKVDKAIDFFYLAVQMNRPHYNPEFRGLVRFDKESQEANLISALTGTILRPQDPEHPQFKSAADILKGLERVERELRS